MVSSVFSCQAQNLEKKVPMDIEAHFVPQGSHHLADRGQMTFRFRAKENTQDSHGFTDRLQFLQDSVRDENFFVKLLEKVQLANRRKVEEW